MTRANWARFSLLAFAAATLWGCGGMTTMSSPFYEAPAGLTAANGATVSKSDNLTGGTTPDGDTHVASVDGKLVNAADTDKVLVAAGRHTLDVKYNGAGAIATVQIQTDLGPGHAYQVKAERTGPCDASIWLEDRGSNAVSSARFPAHLAVRPNPYGASAFAIACD